jgi:hypothetical protein
MNMQGIGRVAASAIRVGTAATRGAVREVQQAASEGQRLPLKEAAKVWTGVVFYLGACVTSVGLGAAALKPTSVDSSANDVLSTGR